MKKGKAGDAVRRRSVDSQDFQSLAVGPLTVAGRIDQNNRAVRHDVVKFGLVWAMLVEQRRLPVSADNKIRVRISSRVLRNGVQDFGLGRVRRQLERVHVP